MQCNRDCFNCIFEDCIVNELLPEDLKEINQRDREIRFINKDNKRKKIAERQRKYHEEHREEINERQRKHRAEHKEEIAEYRRKYYAEHKEAINESQRKYYAAHKDELNERRRKNYQRKKNKKSGCAEPQTGLKNIYNKKSIAI